MVNKDLDNLENLDPQVEKMIIYGTRISDLSKKGLARFIVWLCQKVEKMREDHRKQIDMLRRRG